MYNKYSVRDKILFLILALITTGQVTKSYAQESNWVIPNEVNELKNPLEISDRVLNAGKQIYAQLCAVCHGNKGAGDGITAAALQPKPADFTLVTFQEQTDGAMYHKIREGRPPMPGFETQLTEQQTWAIVHYLRTLSDKTSNN